MTEPKIVTDEQWIEARRELLVKEKEMTRLQDELTAQRRKLPWREIKTNYVFDTRAGKQTLLDLFGPSNQLIVYHFMFGPDWPEGCKICSMLADHYDPLVKHLKARDVSMVTVSRASIDRLADFQDRMGWTFPWASSLDNQFNWDFHVSFTPEQLETRSVYYNYREGAQFPMEEGPGISSFCRRGDQIFHTYSSYGRGLESFLGIYRFLDIVTKGRDEQDLAFPMAWVRHRDGYGSND